MVLPRWQLSSIFPHALLADCLALQKASPHMPVTA
jgi:hypothetical protein